MYMCCCEPNKTVLQCRNLSSVSSIPNIVSGALQNPVPKTIGSVSLDLRCLCRPCVKLDFTAILILPITLAVDFTLTFRVFKNCGNQEIEIDSFEFPFNLVILVPLGTTSQSISFSLCDCDFCPSNCCTYRITAEIDSLLAVTLGSITLNKGFLSALAVDQC